MSEPPRDPAPGTDAPTRSDPMATPRPDADLPLKRLGDFEILREIGRGGMGVVYEARQVSLNRTVALKVLPPGLGLTEQAVQRFHREAQAAAKLHHTHIVPVYAVGEEQGCHFYAMELIEGLPLAVILRELCGAGKSALFEATITKMTPPGQAREGEAEEPRPVGAAPSPQPAPHGPTSLSDTASGSRRWFDTVAKLMAEVAEALHYAHGHGVVHRDIKPANLMLSEDGRLCITDFGLAQVAQEPGMTVSGSLLGTPAYMSPEQVAAGRVKIDHRTDIYSLGTVLYEMLTLRRPFAGDRREEVLSGILTKEPRPPRRVNPRVPLDLETICLKAMEKDPDRRYATAGLLAEDLRAYLSRGLIAARQAGLARRSWKWARRHPIATLATTAAVVVAVVSTIAVQQGFRGSHAEARRLVASAETDIREGTYRDGLEKVEQALKIAPDLFEAKKTRGRLLHGVRRDRELANLATEVLKDHPDDWEAHGWLAFAGKYGGLADIPAEEHVKAVERLAPDSAEAWFVKGLIAPSASEQIRSFDRALERDPGHAWALLQRGMAYKRLCNYPAAIADYERVIAVRPRSPRGRCLLAGVYRDGYRDVERAMAEFDKAIAIDPKDPFIYLERSYVHRDLLSRYDKRLEDLTRAVELAPWNPVLVRERGNALNALGRYQEGLAEGRRGVEIDPNLITLYLAHPVMAALWNLKRIDDLRAAMQERRTRADGWADRKDKAELYASLADEDNWWLGDVELATAEASKAIELDPDNMFAYRTRADASRRKEGQAAVERDCDLLANLEPQEPEPLFNRAGHLYTLCRRTELALADYTKAITMAPAWPDAYSARGYVLGQVGRYREALADLDKAVELAPKWVAALDRRASVHMALEQWPEALVDLERTFALGTESPAIRKSQAEALARLGRDEDALAALDQAIRANPKREVVHRNRAEILFNLGRTDEALAAIDTAIEAEPGTFWPYTARAEMLAYKPDSCARAEADLEKARELEPGSPNEEPNDLRARLRFLVFTCPEVVQPESSLKLAREQVNGWSGYWFVHFHLGLALFQNGRFEEARAALVRTLTFPDVGGWPEPRFWLAMTEAKLGRKTDARRSYALAVERMNATWPKRPQFVRLKAEAEKVLGP